MMDKTVLICASFMLNTISGTDTILLGIKMTTLGQQIESAFNLPKRSYRIGKA